MCHESMAHPLFCFFNRPTDFTDNADLGFLKFVKNYEQRNPSEKLKVVKEGSQKKLKSEIKKSFLYAA